MGRPRKTFVDEGKADIIERLIEAYDIKTPKDIQDALKELLGPTIRKILESEIEEQMGQVQKEDPNTQTPEMATSLKH